MPTAAAAEVSRIVAMVKLCFELSGDSSCVRRPFVECMTLPPFKVGRWPSLLTLWMSRSATALKMACDSPIESTAFEPDDAYVAAIAEAVKMSNGVLRACTGVVCDLSEPVGESAPDADSLLKTLVWAMADSIRGRRAYVTFQSELRPVARRVYNLSPPYAPTLHCTHLYCHERKESSCGPC